MKGCRGIIGAMLVTTASVSAQWLHQPTADIPRTPDGQADLSAPTPRSAGGKPVLAGLWRPSPGIVRDLTAGMQGEDVPYRPWARALVDERRANNMRDDPSARCVFAGVPRADFVGYPFKILQMPGAVVILYEAIHAYRQIFTDGRALPENPNPAWFGYSVGRWEGDTFVVETTGFNDNVWLDNLGRPATEQLRVTERLTRHDFGHMDIDITIEDPTAYTQSWTVTQPLVFLPDTELLEYVCSENNRYFEILPKIE